MPQDLPEVAVFATGRYATAWNADGLPIAWSEWTDADLQRMAENDAALRASGQPQPYIKPSHDAEPVPGFVGALKYRSGKLYAAIEKCADWLADQIKSGVRPWRSAEILRDASAANFQGVTGPVFKGLALLNTHPRVKTLDSAVYADRCADGLSKFEEPAVVAGSSLVTFQESNMDLTAEQTLAALKALGGDQKLLEKLLTAIKGDGGGDSAPEPAAAPAPMADPSPEEKKKEEEKLAAMSDSFAKLKADNDLLRARINEQEKIRERDIAASRVQQLLRFADEISLTHGRAVADKAKAAAERRMVGLSKTDNFSDDGRDLVGEVFSEVKDLLGPATIKRAQTAATQAGGRSSIDAETFSEEMAKEEIFADAHPLELKRLRSPEGEGLLKVLIAARKAEFEKARAV